MTRSSCGGQISRRCFDAGMTNTQVLDLIKKGGIPCGVLGVEYGWLFCNW